MKRKIELKQTQDGVPQKVEIFRSMVQKKAYHHYYFPSIEIRFYDTTTLLQDCKKPTQTFTIKGTAIDNFTFCLKIDEIYSTNALEIFGFVAKYIAENWYTVYKKRWYNKKWEEDPETTAKIQWITTDGNEALISFGI